MVSLRPPYRPNNIADLIQRIQDPERNKTEKKALKTLVTHMVRRFRDYPHPSYYIEASRLSEVVDEEVDYDDLLTGFLNKIIKNSSEVDILDRDLLPSYNYCLRRHAGRAPNGLLVAPLKALSERLKQAIQLADLHAQYHYVFILGALLEIAGDLKVSGLDHDDVHQPLRDQLRDLRKHDEPRLAQVASYAYQALRGVPDNLGPWDVFWRTGGAVLSIMTKLASAVSNMDPDKFIQAAPNFFEMVELFSKLLESIEDIRDSATNLKSAFLQDMERSNNTSRIWFDVLHFTGPLLVAGEQSDDAAAKAFVILEDIVDSTSCGDKWQFWCGLYSQLEQSWINGNDRMKTLVVEFIETKLSQDSLPNSMVKDVRVQGWVDLISTTLDPLRLTIPHSQRRHRSPLRLKKKEHTIPKLRRPFQQVKQDYTPNKLLEDSWKTCHEAHEFYADAGLQRYYMEEDRLMIQRLSGGKLDMEGCYINLSLIEGSMLPTKSPKGFGTSIRGRSKALPIDNEKDIQLHELFRDRKLRGNRTGRPKRILIRGHPGVGKTTLCKKIVHDFLLGKLPWDFDRILWVPLRRLRERSNLKEFLMQEYFVFYPEQEKKLLGRALEKRLLLQSDSRTLYLLDGFDEIAGNVSTEGDIGKMLGFLRERENVIITSRPYAVNLSEFKNLDLELETVGFRPDQVQQYLSQAGNQGEISATQVDQIKAFIENNWSMEELLQIPIQLDAFCYTWGEGLSPENLKTMAALYQAIEVKLWRRDMVQLGKLDQFDADNCRNRTQIERYMKTPMELIEEIAFNGLYNNIAYFSTTQLQDLYGNLPGRAGESNSTIMRHSFFRITDAKEWKQTFDFIHLTFQEFFAANYFVRCWTNDQSLACVSLEPTELNEGPANQSVTLTEYSAKEFLHRWKYSPRYNVMWRFAAGLLCTSQNQQTLIEFMQVLDGEPRDLLGPAQARILMHCFNEIKLPYSEVAALKEIKARMEKTLSRLVSSSLAHEMEFPEYILQATLLNDTPEQKRHVFKALSSRAQISPSLLQQVWNCYLEDPGDRVGEIFARNYNKLPKKVVEDLNSEKVNLQTRLDILACLPRGVKLSDSILLSIIQDFPNLIPTWSGKASAVKLLSQQPSLSDEVRSRLFALLETGSADEKGGAVASLSGHLSNGNSILPKVLKLQAEDDSSVRVEVAKALGLVAEQPEAQESLLSLLHDKDSSVRIMAASSLETMHSLSPKLLDALHNAIEDETPDLSGKALTIWSRHCPSRKNVRETLFRCLDNQELRFKVAQSFSRLSPLSEDIISSLMAEVKSDSPHRQSAALTVLETQNDLSDEILRELLSLLQGETDFRVRLYVCGVFRNQSVLPDFAAQVFASDLHSGDEFIRRTAIDALRNYRILPETALWELLNDVRPWSILEEDEPEGIALLQNQEKLPTGILQKLCHFLRDEERQYQAEKILRSRTEFYALLLPSQGSKVWASLFQLWFESSLHEDWSCYRWEDSLYLRTPQGLHEIPLKTKSAKQNLDIGVKAAEHELHLLAPGQDR